MPPKKEETKKKRGRPARTPEGRESQLVSDAIDLVAKRIRAGTATSQETTHFLKLGSTREKLEQEKIRNENILLEAKVEHVKSQVQSEQMYRDALKAMRTYQGLEEEDFDGDAYGELDE